MQPVLQGAQGIGAGVLLGCLAGRAAIRSKIGIGIGIGIGVFGMRVRSRLRVQLSTRRRTESSMHRYPCRNT